MARKSSVSGNKKSRRFKNKQHERINRKETDKGHKIKRKSKKHQEKSRYKYLQVFKSQNFLDPGLAKP